MSDYDHIILPVDKNLQNMQAGKQQLLFSKYTLQVNCLMLSAQR